MEMRENNASKRKRKPINKSVKPVYSAKAGQSSIAVWMKDTAAAALGAFNLRPAA